jgi:AcrR family transcriptional regulator
MKQINKRAYFFEQTLKLIHQKGFKATTMRDIAEKLNFKVANVYNYVPSKQALLEMYLFDISNEFHTAIDYIIDSTHNPREKLRLVISSYIQITSRRPYEQALLINEWRNLKEPRLKEFIDRRKDYEDKLQAIISAGVDQNQFRALNVELTTQTIMATLRWLYNMYINSEINTNPIEIEKQLINFVFTGVAQE